MAELWFITVTWMLLGGSGKAEMAISDEEEGSKNEQRWLSPERVVTNGRRRLHSANGRCKRAFGQKLQNGFGAVRETRFSTAPHRQSKRVLSH
ncbi:hypothetical protein RIF29_08378 [Crotalaria pallida]|uniref:Secreted protein n=1 Tax=Crotalaria pallida TaxID=3830 RepID=A0AAN9FTB8_CROPI